MSLPESARPHVVVTAAVVERDGRYLVARRLAGTHLEGLWEFPGGKCQSGESAEMCLEREIREELGVEIRIGPLILETSHAYPDRVIKLLFFGGVLLGEPRPLLGQELQWARREDLSSLEFPPADELLIKQLAAKE